MAETMQMALPPFKVGSISPERITEGKKNELLVRTDFMTAGFQVVASGGETNMHAHQGSDEFWLVLEGSARFYGRDEAGEEVVVATLGPRDTLLVPHATPYWFESSGEAPLLILRFGAKLQGVEDSRIDYTPRAAGRGAVVA